MLNFLRAVGIFVAYLSFSTCFMGFVPSFYTDETLLQVLFYNIVLCSS